MRRLLLASSLFATSAIGQGPPANGPRPVDPGFHALVGGDVVVKPGQKIVGATVVLRDGRIVSVGTAPPPAGARIFDMKGLTLYPGLIEAHLPVDVAAPDATAPGAHWSPMVMAQRRALDGAGASAEDRRALRGLGFCAAAIAPTGGEFKGTSAVVLLDDPAEGEKSTVVKDVAAEVLSFQLNFGGYPSSEMGAIALLRQTLMDADWYERCLATCKQNPALVPPARNDALAALVAHRDLPLCFDVEDELQVPRAAKIALEMQRRAFVIGSGFEFRRLPAIAATGLPIVLPLNFPKVPDVGTIAKQERASLRQLLSWEQAPTCGKRLHDAGIKFAFSSARLHERTEFRKNLAAAMACGLDADTALAALTTVPAELLGVGDRLGTLEPGRIANVIAVAGDLFDDKSEIRELWVGGRPHDGKSKDDAGVDGSWTASLLLGGAGVTAGFSVDGSKVELRIGEAKLKGKKVARKPDTVDFVAQGKELGADGAFRFHAVRTQQGGLQGDGRRPDGQEFTWTATAAAAGQETKAVKQTPPPELIALTTPFGAFGMLEPPKAVDVVFSGATLWTAGGRGNVERGALWVRDGKIVYAGPAADLPELPTGTAVVDATGKHISPGIMDCHSHSGISRGVNEGGQAVTAEVRVQDVVNPDDIGWYRELAGGLTAANQLHGSANAIGGQSCTVKLRWGCVAADDMLFAGAPAGIKFALGENPRRANSDGQNARYPNSRMGVEALIRDRFVAAAEYAQAQARYAALSPRERSQTLPPRRDLELDALAEVLAGSRRIHCHSYRQDEIFMLCGLAKEFGFRIGTFQHVLEGYKVAEAIKGAAVGASTFSDWWSYKLEVQDAIPENGAILREVGVVTTFNSDSAELARRLNTEAGKAVKYGGVPAAEAIKFVTLNTAIQLGVQDRCGSLEKGKDADFAVWSGDPLAYTTRCEQTWIDGRPYFTLERDRLLREQAAQLRQRLLQKALLAEGGAGGGGRGDGEALAAKPGFDSYWWAEDQSDSYCCADCGGGR